MKRTLQFKMDAYRFYAAYELSAPHALQYACAKHATKPSGCMSLKNAYSYMSDDIKNYIRKKLAANDSEAKEYFSKHMLDVNF